MIERSAVRALIAVLLLGFLFLPSSGASAVTLRASDLLADLRIAPEQPHGYDRTLFKHWIDADGDGCDTRSEILRIESLVPVVIGDRCKILEGRWYSWYDDVEETDPSTLDIDHVIPLAEAWRSGARLWDEQQRTDFANDLDYEGSLEAVTASSNRSKGDRDPAQWLPPHEPARCQYVTVWVGIKYRWRLTIDQEEYDALSRLLSGPCGDVPMDPPPRAITESAPDPGESEPDPVSFRDVEAGHTFGTDISWLAQNRITTGYDDGTYRPRTQISREAMAAFMYRLAEVEGGGTVQNFKPPQSSPFRDVPPSHAFYAEITWLNSQQITTGYDDGTFRPRTKISREAMAAFMYRYARLTGRATHGMPAKDEMIFDDVVPKHPFHAETGWMGRSGVSTGYPTAPGCQEYRPKGRVTREAMAAFMHRFATGEGTALSLGCIQPPPNPGDIKNCSDFSNWHEADVWFRRYEKWYGDVARLDANNDGVPCESLTGAPRR